MAKQWLGRLSWLTALIILGGVLVAQLGGHTSAPRESSVSSRLAALASCVVPAPAADASASPAVGPDALMPDCEASTPDPRHTVWMTAC